MPNVWGRHPRYALFIFAVIATTFYLLDPFSVPPSAPLPPLNVNMAKGELARRLTRADVIYDKMLADRKEMIRHFGPEPKDIMMCVAFSPAFFLTPIDVSGRTRFPPDKAPWPAYTVCKSSVCLIHTLTQRPRQSRGLFPCHIQLSTRTPAGWCSR
jgi:hypothetical protein